MSTLLILEKSTNGWMVHEFDEKDITLNGKSRACYTFGPEERTYSDMSVTGWLKKRISKIEEEEKEKAGLEGGSDE